MNTPTRVESLYYVNLTLDDLGSKPGSIRTQTRQDSSEFKLIDYPVNEKGDRFDAELMKAKGFVRSHGVEARMENSYICSLVLEFASRRGAYECYQQFLAFVCMRSKYEVFPYVWVPNWNDVDDMLNHFVVAMKNMVATEVPNVGDMASWLYDPLNDFYYVVFCKANLLVMVGKTGSLSGAMMYARIVESKISYQISRGRRVLGVLSSSSSRLHDSVEHVFVDCYETVCQLCQPSVEVALGSLG